MISATIITENIFTQIKITWDQPFDNFDDITAYQIQIRQSDDNTFTETAECNGLEPTVVTSRTCSVELQTLRAAPYLLGFKDFVIVRVRSLNTFGWSLQSQPNAGGAVIQVEPMKMQVPVYIPLSSTLTSIVLQLTPLLDYDSIGGYAVDSYHVQYATTSTWSDVQGQDGSFPLTTTVTHSPLIGGTTYKYQVRAHNIHGWGLWSDIMTEVASGIPETPSPVQVHIVNLDVKVSWLMPNENFATITAYEVKIVQNDGATYTAQLNYCDGSLAGIVSQKYCLIPETVLRASPFALPFDYLITAKVRALNRNGWSPFSAVNADNGVDDKV